MSKKIEKICIFCNKTYMGFAKLKTAKYCSHACYIAGRPSKKLPRIEKSCERCGALFLSIEKDNRKFCSKKCAPPPRPASERPGVINKCEACGKEFYIRFSHRRQKFCSENCKWSVAKIRNPGYKTHTVELLEEYLNYNPDTGILCWLKSPMTKIKAGDIAGTVHGDGYISIVLNGKPILGHIAAWTLFYKKWPKEQIDHRNGIRTDNKITNLREATPLQNARNRRANYNSASGINGVQWSEKDKGWKAAIYVNRKRINLGSFERKEDAIKTRLNAEKEYFGEFRRAA